MIRCTRLWPFPDFLAGITRKGTLYISNISKRINIGVRPWLAFSRCNALNINLIVVDLRPLNINILIKRLNQYERTKAGCTKIDRTNIGFFFRRCLLFLNIFIVHPNFLFLKFFHAILRTSLSAVNNTGQIKFTANYPVFNPR